MRLWTTIIGSHMWGMEHPGSDTDFMEVYIADSKEFLKGNYRKYEGGIEIKDSDKKIDITRYEIGFFIRQLIKGNCNFIWGLFSPLVVYDFSTPCYFQLYGEPEILYELREIFMNNLSKACYHSIRGLAVKNAKKYLTKDKYSDKWQKKLKLICRTLIFGVILLELGEINFELSFYLGDGPLNISDYEYWLDKLDKVYETSDLPAKTDEKPFLDFLLKLRLRDLKDEFI